MIHERGVRSYLAVFWQAICNFGNKNQATRYCVRFGNSWGQDNWLGVHFVMINATHRNLSVSHEETHMRSIFNCKTEMDRRLVLQALFFPIHAMGELSSTLKTFDK